MNPIFAALGRFIVISSTAFGIATVSNYANYRGYWHGTIFRVQTVDFNLLSHTLPAKLSQALIQGNEAEIQRTLDSNYGLFGIVVTDCTVEKWNCPDQKILYKTDSKQQWSRKLTIESLRSAPFNYLRNPPPVVTERGYESSRDATWKLTGNVNQGSIIGRVYYVRGTPPTFQEDFWRWINNPLSLSGGHKYYGLTVALFMVAGIAVQLIIEGILYHKRVQKREALAAQVQAQQENNTLRYHLEQRVQQISVLIMERETFAQQLRTYERDEENRRNQLESQKRQSRPDDSLELKQIKTNLLSEIARREEMIAALQQQIKKQAQAASQNTQYVATLQKHLSNVSVQQSLAKSQLEQTQATIDDLKRQNNQKEQEIQFSTEKLKQAENKLLAEISQREQNITSLQQQIQAASEHTRTFTALQHQLAHALKQNTLAKTQLEQTQATNDDLKRQNNRKDQQIQEMERREAEIRQQRDELEQSIATLKQEREELKKIIQTTETPNLNTLEQAIVDSLQSTPKFQVGQWLVTTHEDVQLGKGIRQFVDVLLISQSCVFVIESKNYCGRIRAAGDPKLTQWFCWTPNGKKVPIHSVGRNPYVQVNEYVDSVMRRLSEDVSANRVVVYGLVVFAEGADLTQIDNCNGRYSRVTSLDSLHQVIQDLETSAGFKTRYAKPQRSPHQIQALLYRLPVRRSA